MIDAPHSTPAIFTKRPRFGRRMYGRIRVISIEETDRALELERTRWDRPASPLDRGEGSVLRGMLRRAAVLRKKEDPESAARLREVWTDIIEHESYTIAKKVAIAGYAQHGRATVDEQDRGEVVGDVMRRLIRLMETFEGTEVGQLRKAINQAVEWSVLDYARAKAHTRENEIPVEPSAWDPGSVDPEDRPGYDLTGLITAAAVSDRIEMVERLRELNLLNDRERDVVVLRTAGFSSKEIAAQLDLTPANVDQIYHRSIKRLRQAETEGATDA